MQLAQICASKPETSNPASVDGRPQKEHWLASVMDCGA
jgi:hypothetical protein